MCSPVMILSRLTAPMIVPARSYSPSAQAGHLGSLAPDQRAAVGPARLADALHHLLDDHVFEFSGSKVIQKEKWRSPLHRDVVHTMVHQVLAHRMVNPKLEGNLQFRADAVSRGDQHRVGKLFQIQRKQAAETADLGQHLPIEGLARQHLDALLAAVGRGDVHACVGVAYAFPRAGRRRSGLLRTLLQADRLLLVHDATERGVRCGCRLRGGRIWCRGGLIRQGIAPYLCRLKRRSLV